MKRALVLFALPLACALVLIVSIAGRWRPCKHETIEEVRARGVEFCNSPDAIAGDRPAVYVLAGDQYLELPCSLPIFKKDGAK